MSVVKCWHAPAISINTRFGFVVFLFKCHYFKFGKLRSPICDMDFRCECVYACMCVGDEEVEIALGVFYNS